VGPFLIFCGGEGRAGRSAMIKNVEELQKYSKDSMDLAMKSFGSVSKSLQAIAVEMADYSKKSFEDSTAAVEKLMGAKTIEKALEVQSDYAKSAYEGFVAEATKIGEMYSDLAKETYKPFEGLMAKASSAA
jgi:phasin family protein